MRMKRRFRHRLWLFGLVVACSLLSACGDKADSVAPASATTAFASAAASAAAQPASAASASVAGAGIAPYAGAPRSPESIYQTACGICHDAGVAGAPKLADKQAWAPRIATGMDAMMQTVLHGKNAMPPRGTMMDASEAELKAVAEYMVRTAQ